MSSSEPTSVYVDGLSFPPGYTEESVKSAQNYCPREDDVIVLTYPKCGTTWTQVILALIYTQGDPEGAKKLFASSPFLELKGSREAETMTRPGIIKTHLPFGRAPWSDKAKYIFVSRNPKDCCVSYFHHYKGHDYSGDFDHFFEMFIEGRINFGDYFDYLMGWYEQRNKTNILFITYEEMKEDTKAAILKMASFIDDKKYAEPLRENDNKLKNILKYSSPDQTKEIIRRNHDKDKEGTKPEQDKEGMKHEHAKDKGKIKYGNETDIEGMKHGDDKDGMKPKQDNDKEIVNIEHDKDREGMKYEQDKYKEGMKQENQKEAGTNKEGFLCKKHGGNLLVRKGIIGDWRNHFSEEQSKRLDKKTFQLVKGSDFVDIWKKYM